MSAWLSTASVDGVAASWVPILVDAALKGLAVLAVAGVAVVMMRRASASARHLVWFLTVVSLGLLPALSAMLPGWQVLPHWLDLTGEADRSAASEDATAPVPLAEAEHAEAPDAVPEPPAPLAPTSPDVVASVESPTPVAPQTTPGSDAETIPLAADRPPLLAPVAPSTPQTPSPATMGPAVEPARTGAPRHRSVWAWIFLAWAVGASLIVARLGLGRLSLWRLGRTSRAITGQPWDEVLDRLTAELGVKQPVVLLQSERRSMPMTWGIFRPKLLLPAAATNWSAERRRVVVLHELAHVRRCDYLTLLIAQLVCAAYWFNPLVWIASHRMVSESERACDDVVLGSAPRPADYAEHLLQVASGCRPKRFEPQAAIALARPSHMEGRLLAILDRTRSRRPVTTVVIAFALVVTTGLVLPLATARPADKAEAETASSETPSAAPTPEGDEPTTKPTARPSRVESAFALNKDVPIDAPGGRSARSAAVPPGLPVKTRPPGESGPEFIRWPAAGGRAVPIPEHWDAKRLASALYEYLSRQAERYFPGCQIELRPRGSEGLEIRYRTREYAANGPVVYREQIGPQPDGLIVTVCFVDRLPRGTSLTPGRDRVVVYGDKQYERGAHCGYVYLPDLKTYLYVQVRYGPKTDRKLVRAFCAPTRWLQAITSAGARPARAEAPANTPPVAISNRVEGAFALRTDTPIQLVAGTARHPWVWEAGTIRFTAHNGRLYANLDTFVAAWVEAGWRLTVALLDERGNVLSRAHRMHDTTRITYGEIMSRCYRKGFGFSFGESVRPEQVARFAVEITEATDADSERTARDVSRPAKPRPASISPSGKGKLWHMREKATKRHYYLYLPGQYKAQLDRGVKRPVHPATTNGLWPLVVSFHGMKPFDRAVVQPAEWRAEADRYGFIMIAPKLMSSDLFMEFPLEHADHPCVQGDEKASVGIIREVTDNLPVDEHRVLATSWSSGGYLAHYMVNRHPDLFSCLAVRQSNFSADLLDPRQVAQYRDMPIGVFWTQRDMSIWQSESRAAVAWYRRHGFRDISWATFACLGHRRIPEMAAALFAVQCGIGPRTPAGFTKPIDAHGRSKRAIVHALQIGQHPPK